jgi:3-oxoacid CoA-transferase subunit B
MDLMYIDDGHFILRERAPGVSIETIREKTAGPLVVPDYVPEMAI